VQREPGVAGKPGSPAQRQREGGREREGEGGGGGRDSHCGRRAAQVRAVEPLWHCFLPAPPAGLPGWGRVPSARPAPQ
jgi:hypothetical protein